MQKLTSNVCLITNEINKICNATFLILKMPEFLLPQNPDYIHPFSRAKLGKKNCMKRKL
jgi:hypothetical protein